MWRSMDAHSPESSKRRTINGQCARISCCRRAGFAANVSSQPSSSHRTVMSRLGRARGWIDDNDDDDDFDKGEVFHPMRRRTLLGLFRVYTPDAGSASESPSKVNCR
jgi:hypothetical protein